MKKPTRTNQTYIGLWVPLKLANQIKTTVKARESDMSKFIRAAVREKLDRVGTVEKEGAR